MQSILAIPAVLYLGTALPVFVAMCFALVNQQRPLRFTRAQVGSFSREWGAMVLIVLAWPFGLLPFGPRPFPSEEDRVPVLLVPGYAMNRSGFVLLAIYLRRMGWRWVWGINNGGFNKRVPDYAEKLRAKVEKYCEKTGAEQVDLVAHSMGGVISAFYINQLGGDQRVRQLVTIATPWQGTRTWVFARRRAGQDLRPDSPVVEAIQECKVPTRAIWSQADGIVVPAEAGYTEGVMAHEVASVGHQEQLLSWRVFRLVADFLRGDLAELEDEPTETLLPEVEPA